MHRCDNDEVSIGCTRKFQLRRSLSTGALSKMGTIGSKWNKNFTLDNQNEPLPTYAILPKDMPNEDFVSVASGNRLSHVDTPPESVGRHSKMSGGALFGIVTPRKRKSDEAWSYEFYPFAQKKVPTNKLTGLGKRSTSVVSLNEQLSSYEAKQNELQSFSNHSRQSCKKVMGDVLKDRTNTSKDIINKYQEKFHQLLDPSVSTEEMCFAHCNTTEPIPSSASRVQECRPECTQEHRVTELSEDARTSDMNDSETAERSARYDDSGSCNAGYYVEAAKCVDANNGASCLRAQATDHSKPLPVLESCVPGNAVEEQQCKTNMLTQHKCKPLIKSLEPAVYPRPLAYGHTLTRNQYQNRIESTKNKICLNVEDVLTSEDNCLRPELRTRSTKAESWRLKKLLQDVTSYPTVVLRRLDENAKKQPPKN
jgi:hypothetical protein